MLMTRFPLKRLIAALLPISFLWLFVACISHCLWESAETHECHAALSSFEMEDAPDADACPIAAAPKATIPERKVLDLQTTHVVQHPVYPARPSLPIVASSPWPDEPSLPDPPLDRLPTLRI